MSEIVRCSARTSAGKPCKRTPMRGASVCASHGGSAPQVRRKAQERILAAADPASAKLVQLMSDKRVPYNVQLAAAKDLLDRAGLSNPQDVQVTLRRYEQVLDDVIVEIDYDVEELPPGGQS